MYKLNFLIFLFLFGLNENALSQIIIEKWSSKQEDKDQEYKKIREGINYIYNLEYDKAEKIFDTVKKSNHENPIGFFFDGMVLWWKIMINIEDVQYDELFKEKMSNVIDICDRLIEKESENSTAIFYKAAALGFRGRLLANRGEWLNAAIDGKNALPLVGQLSKIEEENNDVEFGLGLYNYYAEAIPEKYPILKPITIFFPKGNKQKAIKQLNNAVKNAKYADIEALYFLMQIYYMYEYDYKKALEYATILYNKFPKNILFKAYIGRINSKLGNTLKTSLIYNELIELVENSDISLYKRYLDEANYYIGYSFMKNGESNKALAYYGKVCQNKNDSDFSNKYFYMSLYNMGNIYILKNDFEKARNCFIELINMNDCCDLHKKAQKKLKQIENRF
ncbi:Tetratricopeptide domain protein [Chloroherpeton thalassium ATCC 35110]|uniref:Tetratricopeptide domain protein n=1 Tax=Chloroherpeton thalassium (strain ATCC 35110 / GB-78) TaxID=517418 RepID=B3QUD1_CHLT3|nr:tetratricopeptide repeat protein [Chloroherpeton thalassium]ACF14380.1 Tetratricopeptide domain protein [Chloroherpeton thalassium ATCC 35110]